MGQTFTRQELYDLVWSQPRTTIAKQLGVSDVWVGKQCRTSHIPMPPAGYWARLQHGKRSLRPPLPIRLPGQLRTISVGETTPSVYWRRQESVDELILPPVIDEKIDAQVEAAARLIGKVSATRDLSTPHQGLSRVLKREADRRSKFAANGWSMDRPLFDGPIHQRQLRLFNSLCSAFERISARGEVSADSEWIQGVGTVHRLSLRVDFGGSQLNLRVLDPNLSASELGEKPPSATTLRVGSARGDLPVQEWSDRPGCRLEQQLAAIAKDLLYRAERTYRHDAQRHYEWRLERRQEHLKELEAQRLEAERRRLAAIEARRKRVLEGIKSMALDARTAQDIRTTIERLDNHPDLRLGRPAAFDGWRAEALALADRLDPMNRSLDSLLADFVGASKPVASDADDA
ncbi:hypothetical protein C1M51_09075 [Methylibium sp. Pch-M]|uniref:hypothetical protein n=1 Tax=Methylibium sp. Pch-M TaxID=2082386 RepID=UPI001011BD67|nr:hypothetical protein [Methylibium sp. Pch-M]QAZ39575.1 hypothetical protein C1M51_09075 [Methylibium sp. Pch-M]